MCIILNFELFVYTCIKIYYLFVNKFLIITSLKENFISHEGILN